MPGGVRSLEARRGEAGTLRPFAWAPACRVRPDALICSPAHGRPPNRHHTMLVDGTPVVFPQLNKGTNDVQATTRQQGTEETQAGAPAARARVRLDRCHGGIARSAQAQVADRRGGLCQAAPLTPDLTWLQAAGLPCPKARRRQARRRRSSRRQPPADRAGQARRSCRGDS